MDFITSGVAMMMIGIRLMNRPGKVISLKKLRANLAHHACECCTMTQNALSPPPPTPIFPLA